MVFHPENAWDDDYSAAPAMTVRVNPMPGASGSAGHKVCHPDGMNTMFITEIPGNRRHIIPISEKNSGMTVAMRHLHWIAIHDLQIWTQIQKW